MLDHDSQNLAQKIIKDAKVTIFGQLKKSTEIDQSITFTCLVRKFPTKAHFEANSILYNFSSLSSRPKMLHLRDMSQNITGHFKSQQKDTFCQKLKFQG